MKEINISYVKQIIYFSLIAAVVILSSCRKEEFVEFEDDIIEVIDPVDWSEETHGESTDPDYSVVFNQEEVLRFDIKISSKNWSAMQANLATILGSSGVPGRPPGGPPGGGDPMGTIDSDPVWVPCSVYFNGKEWYKVGVRYKGNSSLRSAYSSGIKKLSFKLDFDQFEDDYPLIENQRFYGFHQLNLKNNYADNSLMREKVASDLFLEFGLVSPQTAFCVVYVDYGSGPVYYGVYSLVEEVDDTVMESQFGSETGNLYKPEGNAASFASGSYNETQMEKKNNEKAADYSDVYSLYTTLNSSIRTTDAEKWKEELNKVLDVDGFLQWLAANTAMQNWDTYGVMTHNYYLYNDTSNGLLTWIPWDNNEALQYGKQDGALSLSLDDVGSTWPLIRYLIDVPEYKEHYRDYLLEFIDTAFDPDKMISIYNEYYELLKEHAYAEVSGYTFLRNDAEFDAAVEVLKDHAQARNEAVISYLGK
jgi:spore coat protein H